MPDGWKWLLAKCCFPSQSPHITQGAVQNIKVCAAVMMCNGWSCSFSLLLQCFHFQSPQHLHTPLLSLQMKDRTQRGARSPGQLTNHIHPRGAASQVQYIHTNLFSFLLSDSCHWFMPNPPTSSKRQIMPSDGGFSSVCVCKDVFLLCFAWCCTVLNAWIRWKKNACVAYLSFALNRTW